MGTLFGASWKSTVIGFLAAVIQYFASLGPNLPVTPQDWGHAFLSAILLALGMVVKDSNVSNAPNPAPAAPVK